MDAGPAVSVVVPTYRRDRLLRRCLDSLVRQAPPSGGYEIVVVDDARSRTVPEVVTEAAAGSGVRLVCLPGPSRGPAAARNVGWRAARGRVITFIDDDAYPADPNRLRNGLAAMNRAQAEAISGRVTVPADDPPTDFQRNVMRLERATFLTCNAFV